jgi:hypothetical protein
VYHVVGFDDDVAVQTVAVVAIALVHFRFSVSYAKLSGLTDILYQRDGDYSIAVVPSRWDNGGAKVCGAGGRYRSEECGLTVL